MAIAKTTTLVTPEKVKYQRESVLPAPQPIAVDTQYTPRASLLQYVSGARWSVNYYKQIKTSENATESFNINRLSPYQQYEKIENFEIKVTGSLENSYNGDLAQHDVSGSGLIYPTIVPATGDVFIADIGDGQSGIFSIENINVKSYFKDTVYEIEYKLAHQLTSELLDKLEACVVRNTYYERAYADYGANPRLEIEQHGFFKRIVTWQKHIVHHYFNMFFNNEYQTFLIPIKGQVIYDPFIVEFITRIWSIDDCSQLMDLKVYNRDTGNNNKVTTIWDVILENNYYLISTCRNRFAAIPKTQFKTSHRSLMGVAYSRLEYIYHPITVMNGKSNIVEIYEGNILTLPESYAEYTNKHVFTLNITKLPGIGFVHSDLQELLPVPDAKKYGTFDTYLLSPAFYNRDVKEMSKVERMLTDVLQEKSIEAKELIPILEDVMNWGDVEQFYYIPLLVALSKSALGDLSQ